MWIFEKSTLRIGLVHASKTPIFLGTKSLDLVAEFLIKNKSSHVYILVDANTQKYCLPILLTRNPTLSDAKVIKLPIGESTKSLIVFEEVCVKLLQENVDRDSLIINLGGGVVCDFGGFLSSKLYITASRTSFLDAFPDPVMVNLI